MRNAQSFIAWFVNFFVPFDEQILVVGRLKAEFSRIYFCDGQILKITEGNDYEIIHVKCTSLLNEKLNSFQLSYSLVHVKTCINSYVKQSWFYLTFLSLLNSCLTVTVTYIRNRKRAFTIEPISLILISQLRAKILKTSSTEICPAKIFAREYFQAQFQ